MHRVPRRNLCRRQQRVDQLIDLVAQSVVLRVEKVVHHRQRDVFVAASVARGHVQVEQLVVVRAGRLDAGAEVADRRVGVWHETRGRHGVVRDVIEELMIGVQRVGRVDAAPAIRRRVALAERGRGCGSDHQLRESVGARLEVPVRIGEDQWHIEHVPVEEPDSELGRRLGLDLGPVADVADLIAGDAGAARRAESAVEHFAVLHRLSANHHVLAQEHLMGRMRGVGLVLIDPRRRLIDAVVNVVGRSHDAVRTRQHRCAGHHHEVGRAARDEQRIVRLQRHDHVAVAALVHEVEAVIEELAEEREHQIERRREPEVGRDVRDEQRAGIRVGNRREAGRRRAHEAARAARVRGRRDGRGVGCRLIDDQVGRDARLRVDDISRRLRVRRPGLGGAERRRGPTREDLIGRAKQVLIGDRYKVVERPVNGSQTARELRIVNLVGARPEQRSAGGVILRDEDLVVDEPQIFRVDREPGSGRGRLCVNRRRHEQLTAYARHHHRDRQSERPTSRRSWTATRQKFRTTHDLLQA